MNNRNILAAIIASLMVCGTFASCSSSKNKNDSASEMKSSLNNSDTSADIEESIAVKSGDAYLAINEEKGWIKYFGINDDPSQSMLSYNAGVVPINGNGSYTVSVTADTNGFRLDTTGDVNDNSIVPSGLMFAALMIKDGNILFPNAVITIDSIVVDGRELTLAAKGYTSSDDEKELRSNIYNQWVTDLPDDAVSIDGALVVNGNPIDAASEYSPCIVNPDDFEVWTTVEVNFTVSGIE